MFVKICGITNRDDAFAAIEAGAAALGFIFHEPSPRYVPPESLAPWIEEIPADIWKAGVFVDKSPKLIEETAARLHLDVIQLHGQEEPRQYPSHPRLWKAIRISQLEQALRPVHHPTLEALLLDGPANGQTFHWSLTHSLPPETRFILAGGLNPENVREAIAQTNPWGVDVASGVESSPGRKNHARMKQFIKAALSA